MPIVVEITDKTTDLINSRLSDPTQHLKVFDPNGVYLPTKKIGKNNPWEAEIKADNAARQEWNRMADVALVTGIAEEKIIEIKETEILGTVKTSIKKWGWLPDLFRSIVGKAKDFLQSLIREQAMPPKPTLDIDMTEFRTMRNLMIRVQNKAKGIKHLQDKVLPGLKQQLADTKGVFKGKERKALTTKIEETEQALKQQLEEFPEILKAEGYPDVQAFMRAFRQMEAVVEQYHHDLAQWEHQTGKTGSPPEKESVREKLRQLQQQGKQKHARKKSFDQER